MKIFKKVKLLIIFGLVTILSFGVFNKTVSHALTYSGLGKVDFEWEREIYDDVNLTHTMSYNRNKEQKTYTIEFNPKTAALKPIVTTGPDTVLYGNTMSTLINHYEQQGYHVVFGVNGDGYDTSNGIPSGIGINNGILLNSSTDKLGWGITADGEVKYGSAKLPMNFITGSGATVNLGHVNKERKLNTTDVYLLTENFNSTTESTQAGVEVVLAVDANQDGLRIGEPYKLTVERIVQVDNNTSGNKTEIGKGKAVLSTHQTSPHYNTLSNLKVGESITVNVNDNNDSRIDWSEIVAGMGIFHLLLDQGEETGHLSNQDIHPRTAMGIKADGTVVLMQNDGRQSGWANGLSFREMVHYMRDELGCETVFNFDGGGSSTIAATIPGDDRATILNSPSDGQERSNANAFLLVSTEEPAEDKEVEKIHLYPSITGNYATKGMILENGKMSFYATATDKNYYPVSLSSPVSYRVESDGASIGEIDSAGNFTARKGRGTGRIIASSGGKEASFDIEVVDEVDKIETRRTIISVGPHGSTELTFNASKEGIPIILSTEALSFKVSPSSIGEVSPGGKFTAKVESGTGHLEVSYKDFSLQMPIEIGKLPVPIADFERDIFSDHSWVKHFVNMPNNGGSGEISINRDERYVKHGDGSLRIDYDFQTSPLTGTVAIEISERGGTVLEGQPEAIGAWVYGDGNGGWFRIQLSEGNYAGSTRIDWVGWKYIETPIPKDAPFPYTVDKMVRLIGTPTIANNTKGTIYVDSVRAIYSYKNDDNEGPVAIEETIKPSQGSSTSNRQEVISLRVKDSDVAPVTGVDTERTQMFINNKKVENIRQTVNSDGSVDISFNPSALDRLRPGIQNVRVRVEDNFGNKTFIEWSFILEGYAVNLTEEYPDSETIYAGEEFSYKIDTESYRDFEQVELELSYDSSNIELLDHFIDDRLLISDKEIDEVRGKVKYILIGMNNLEKEEDFLFLFNFKAKESFNGSTGIKVDKAIIREKSEDIAIYLEGYDKEIKYKYLLNIFETTYNEETRILLTENQNPVSGAKLIAYTDGLEVELGEEFITDINGEIITNFFTDYDVGTKFLLYFSELGLVSNTVSVEVLASLGAKTPDLINITVGEDPSREVGISFQTNHEVEEGKVWISENEDLSEARVIEAERTIVYTTYNKKHHQFSSWGAFINDLTPDTKYYYQVGSEMGKSKVLSFKTPNDTGDYDIAVYGDIQGGWNTFSKVQEKLNQMYPNVDLNLIAGDVADNAHIRTDWTSLYEFSGDYFNSGIWSSAIGNHDVTDEGLTFSNFFYGPLNGVAPEYGARNYYFELGDFIIYNFDTEAGFNSYDPHYTKQKAHLLEVMKNSDKTFKIVLMHRSSYPLNYNELNIRELSSTFEEAGVDLVLSGHDHLYNRVSMKEGSKVEVHEGITYIVTGTSSGGKYYSGDETRPWAGVVYTKKNPVFMMMKIRDGNRLEYESYALEGNSVVPIDSFIIEKNEVEVEEENFEYIGPLGFTTGGTLRFKIQAELGYVVESVKVNGVKVLYDQDGYYNYEGLEEDAIITVELEEGYNRYDINGDSVLTKEDAIAILEHITGTNKLSEEYLALLGLTEEDLTMAFAREILEKVGDLNEK